MQGIRRNYKLNWCK